MSHKPFMTISDFARLTGIKRANLRFYDQIGLLAPERRGENDYRYYTRRQLSTAYLIVALRELGIGLEEIKAYADGRSPARLLALFAAQEKRIRMEIEKLHRMREMMGLYVDMAQEALDYEAEGIRLEQRESEPIFLGPPAAAELTEEAALLSFYDFAAERGIDLGYPLGAIIARQHFEVAAPSPVLQFYFKVQHGQNAYKPAGRYAVAYGRCALGQTGAIFKRLLAFIEAHQLRICSDAYEEYPLNELSIQDEEHYCAKVAVLVEPAGT